MAARELHRLATGLLERLGKEYWGFPPRLAPIIVEQLGPVRTVSWFANNLPRYGHTRRTMGPLRLHLICMAISLHNGNRYSSYGHAYAAELIYFRKRGRLMPVDARALSEWIDLPPGELRDRLCDVLQRAELHVEVIWVDRTLALTTGEQWPVDQDEARIVHLVRMFAVLDAISITGKVEPDEAHDPINKDTALKIQHAALRGTPA
jgi:hypothetical protein